MGSPAPGSSTITRQRPTPDPIRGTPQAMVPVAEELIEDPAPDGGRPRWVMAESVAIGILCRHYGWTGFAPGHLVKIRPLTEAIGSSDYQRTLEAALV